jgi:hypothetical protein
MIATRTEVALGSEALDAGAVVRHVSEAEAVVKVLDNLALAVRLAATAEEIDLIGKHGRVQEARAQGALHIAWKAATATQSFLGEAARSRVFSMKSAVARSVLQLEEALHNWSLPVEDTTTLRLIEMQKTQQVGAMLLLEDEQQGFLEERRAELLQIERDVMLLGELQTDVASLLALQVPAMEAAEGSLEAAVADSTQSVEHLREAEKTVNKSRKRKFWLVVGVSVVILTVGLGILVWRKIVV